MLELIQEVMGLVRQQRELSQQPSHSLLQNPDLSNHRKSIIEFRKIAPPIYKGAANPREAEAWINEMEKAFRAMECIDEEKIRFATYMLQDRAHY